MVPYMLFWLLVGLPRFGGEILLPFWKIWPWACRWWCCNGKQPYNFILLLYMAPICLLCWFSLCVQENSFLRPLGHLELDLPEAPEKAPRPPAQAVDPFSKFGPKAEISHIFRAPEKRPPKELSLAFMGLTLLPFIGFLIGVSKIVILVMHISYICFESKFLPALVQLIEGLLLQLVRLGVNLKNFPSLPGPAAFASLFHAGIGAVLLLYVLFWLKVCLVPCDKCYLLKLALMFTSILVQLDLFTTLKYLGFLGIFLVFVGHRTLSYLSSVSTKQKTAWVDNANRVFPIINFWGGHCRPLGVFAWYSDRTQDFLELHAFWGRTRLISFGFEEYWY